MTLERDIQALKRAIKEFILKTEKERLEKIRQELLRLSRSQRELSKWVADIKQNKERIAELENLLVKPEEVRSLELKLGKEIEDLKKLVSGNSKEIGRLGEEVQRISSALADVQGWISKGAFRREIEALRARERIVETKLRQLEPVLERLDSLEREIKRIRVITPFIIE